jgi:hypothetical protein
MPSRQTNPWDLDAEMITRHPVATAEDHHNQFMAIDGVVGGMQDADALLLVSACLPSDLACSSSLRKPSAGFVFRR